MTSSEGQEGSKSGLKIPQATLLKCLSQRDPHLAPNDLLTMKDPGALLAHRVRHEIHGAPEKGLVGVSLCELEPSARPRGRYEYNLNNEKVPKNFLERNLTPFALLEACVVVLFARVRYTQRVFPVPTLSSKGPTCSSLS
jgi:hypothetical protein